MQQRGVLRGIGLRARDERRERPEQWDRDPSATYVDPADWPSEDEAGGRKGSTSYVTARTRRTQQSELEPTWTDLLSLASPTLTSGTGSSGTGSSGSSSDTTSLPTHSSQSTYLAPASALDLPVVTPSMSPTQPPRRRGSRRRTPFPTAAAPRASAPRNPGTPSGTSSSISAVRETLRQCGDTPITRMLVAELDRLEAPAYHAQGLYAEHYAGQVGQRQAGRLKTLLLVLRTLIRDSIRRWFRDRD